MSSMPPEPSPGGAGTSPASGAVVLVEGYRVDHAEIPQQYRRSLREYVGALARALRSRPGSSLAVTLVGHTDSTGTEHHNTVLGLNRALGVQRAMETLMPQDVAAQVRYHSLSGGENAPVAPNATVRDRARNRRVEVRGVLTLPVVPKQKPPPSRTRLEPPPLLSPPCQKFEKAKTVFGAKYKVLIELESVTSLHFPKSGRPTLQPAEPGGYAVASIDAVAEAILGKVQGDVLEKVLGPELAEGWGAVFEQVSTLSTLEQQRRYDEMSGNPSGPAARRMHRLLVAEQVAKAEGAQNWIGRAYELVDLMEKYQRLLTDCEESRGTQRRTPTMGPTPPEYLRRREPNS
jgi:hypothetical protein